MATQIFDFQPGTNILTPVQMPQDARMDAADFAPSLTFVAGQALGRKSSDNLLYPLVSGASDGTQTFVAFAAMSVKTDANGKIYAVTGSDTAVAHPFAMPMSTAPIYTKGTFDPKDLTTRSVTAQQVDTFTPGGTIEVGDIFTLTYTAPDLQTTSVSFTATATTAANVSAGLIAAWNANATLAAVATASGTSTVVLTAVRAGDVFSVAGTTTEAGGGAADDQTFQRTATTAAAGRSISDITGGAPGARVLHNGYWDIP